MQKKKRRESPQSVSNGWCNSISSVGKEKNHSELCSGFTSRTFSACLVGGLTDAAATQLVISTLPQLGAGWRTDNRVRGLQEDRIQQQQQHQPQRASRLSLPGAGGESDRWDRNTSAHKHQTAAARRSAHMKGSDIRRSAVGTHRDDFADGVRLKCFFFLLVSYLCLHSGLCARRRRAESKSAPMWRETPGGELTGRTHSHSPRCDITLVASDAQLNWLFFFLLFHQNSNFLVWIYDGNI